MTFMNMADVVKVCREIGIEPQATPHGVRIGTTGWRIESGGGIAGNSGQWWVQPIAGMYPPNSPDGKAKPLGPATTSEGLKTILLGKWPRLGARDAGKRMKASVNEMVGFIEWVAEQPCTGNGSDQLCRVNAPHDMQFCCVACRAHLLRYGRVS